MTHTYQLRADLCYDGVDIYIERLYGDDTEYTEIIPLTDLYKDLEEYDNSSDFFDDLLNRIGNRLHYTIEMDDAEKRQCIKDVLSFYEEVTGKSLNPKYLVK